MTKKNKLLKSFVIFLIHSLSSIVWVVGILSYHRARRYFAYPSKCGSWAAANLVICLSTRSPEWPSPVLDSTVYSTSPVTVFPNSPCHSSMLGRLDANRHVDIWLFPPSFAMGHPSGVHEGKPVVFLDLVSRSVISHRGDLLHTSVHEVSFLSSSLFPQQCLSDN